MRILPRVCFVLLVSFAVASVLGGVGCTRRGTPSVLPTGSAATSRTVYVDPKKGSDSNNGAQATPYKTLTKALAAATNTSGVPITDIELAAGDYSVASGEKFPLVVQTALTINGTLYGRGASRGAFLDGAGEDTAYEKIVGATTGSYYATLEIGTMPTLVTITNLYVGNSKPSLPSVSTVYNSVNVLGNLTASTSSFNVQPKAGGAKLNGVLVPSGTFACSSCAIGGNVYAIAAISLPNPTAVPNQPEITLTGPAAQGQGAIGGRIGIYTDGSIGVVASNQQFTSAENAYRDDYPPLNASSGTTPAGVDFGQGEFASTGNNVLLNVGVSGIAINLPGDVVTAFGDTWTPNQQGTNLHGVFRTNKKFQPGASGKIVTISSSATGAYVQVGPFMQPTPSPSPTASPSGGPSASPSPTASASTAP